MAAQDVTGDNAKTWSAQNMFIVGAGDDSNDLPAISRGVCVATAGNIKVTTAAGQTGVWPAPAGWSPVRLTRIWAASLTAVGITAWW